jgi:hypothetical protein
MVVNKSRVVFKELTTIGESKETAEIGQFYGQARNWIEIR